MYSPFNQPQNHCWAGQVYCASSFEAVRAELLWTTICREWFTHIFGSHEDWASRKLSSIVTITSKGFGSLIFHTCGIEWLFCYAPQIWVGMRIWRSVGVSNSMLAGIPQKLINKVQGVMNCAAHLVCKAPKHEHVTPPSYGFAVVACRMQNRIQDCYSLLQRDHWHCFSLSVRPPSTANPITHFPFLCWHSYLPYF